VRIASSTHLHVWTELTMRRSYFARYHWLYALSHPAAAGSALCCCLPAVSSAGECVGGLPLHARAVGRSAVALCSAQRRCARAGNGSSGGGSNGGANASGDPGSGSGHGSGTGKARGVDGGDGHGTGGGPAAGRVPSNRDSQAQPAAAAGAAAGDAAAAVQGRNCPGAPLCECLVLVQGRV